MSRIINVLTDIFNCLIQFKELNPKPSLQSRDINQQRKMVDMLTLEIEIEKRVKAVERRLRSVEQPRKSTAII